jgi:hypothetical protein
VIFNVISGVAGRVVQGSGPPSDDQVTPEICTNSMRKFVGVPRVPSAAECSAPTAPRLSGDSGPPSHKSPATPLNVIWINSTRNLKF